MKKRRFLQLSALGLAFPGLLAPTIGYAQDPSVTDIIIGEVEKRILRDYYAEQLTAWQQSTDNSKGKKKGHKDIPPGIAKKGTLPPGIAKQLVRNGQIPPGMTYQGLPPDLLARLPQLSPEYRYVIADDRVMLIQAATNRI